MKTKSITQTVTLPARPPAVFAALMNSRKHGEFTGAPAQIDPRNGGAFHCYGRYITGISLDVVRNKRIVQAWRSRGWPKGFFSIVTFALAARAGKKTTLRFTHTGVPASDFRAKTRGWRTHYWDPLRRYLAAHR